jgi:hypothetical protein
LKNRPSNTGKKGCLRRTWEEEKLHFHCVEIFILCTPRNAKDSSARNSNVLMFRGDFPFYQACDEDAFASLK